MYEKISLAIFLRILVNRFQRVAFFSYRASQNYRIPLHTLKTIKLSPTKKGLITDLMP
jgi:hypothetical protein